MNTTGWIVLIFIVFLIFSINAWLVAILRRKSSPKGNSMWKNASDRIRNPWINEDNDIHLLSKLVGELKKGPRDIPHDHIHKKD